MTRARAGFALGLAALVLVLAACAHAETEVSTNEDSTLGDRASDDHPVGSAASLPPSYARGSAASGPNDEDPDQRADNMSSAPECHFDADCDDGRMCDHGSCMKWWRMKGEVPEVAPEDLYWQVQRGEVQVVDVRTLAEFRLGRIAGAMHVPIQTLPDRVDDLPLDKDKPVVAICLTAHRSIAAVRLLSRHGYDVVQLQGGMTAWARSKLPVIRGRDVDVTE